MFKAFIKEEGEMGKGEGKKAGKQRYQARSQPFGGLWSGRFTSEASVQGERCRVQHFYTRQSWLSAALGECKHRVSSGRTACLRDHRSRC